MAPGRVPPRRAGWQVGRGSRCPGPQFPHQQRERTLPSPRARNAGGSGLRRPAPPPHCAPSAPALLDLLPRAAHAHHQQRAGRRHRPESRRFLGPVCSAFPATGGGAARDPPRPRRSPPQSPHQDPAPTVPHPSSGPQPPATHAVTPSPPPRAPSQTRPVPR